MDNTGNPKEETELRKVQTIHNDRTFVVVLPKNFVTKLKVTKGDYVKCRLSDGQLILERAEV